jgi:hypothetical protein
MASNKLEKSGRHDSRAIQSLSVCLDRSRQCLEDLRAGLTEEFLISMSRQHVAFQNFRSLDHVALMAGQNITQIEEAHRLQRDIQSTHQEIKKIQEAQLANLQTRMEKIGRASRGVKNYGKSVSSAKFIKLI